MPSETKWTPGPWRWSDRGGGCVYLRAANRDDCPDFDGMDPIADDGSAGGEYEQTIRPDSPNATLIAAAPELYEALEAFTDGTTRDWTNRMAKARAALAKARGEQPQVQDVPLEDCTRIETLPPETPNLPTSFDAKDWASGFVATVKWKPGIATDESTMLTWFASAIMAGYDEARRRFDFHGR